MPYDAENNPDDLVELTVEVICAYVSNNAVPVTELRVLIGEVYAAFKSQASGAAEAEVSPPKPTVPIKKSVTPDYIVCLEDGKKFKSLKRHLTTNYGMTPDEYRKKWGLPGDYPMVAPNYAAARSALAKSMGLGRKRKQAQQPMPTKRGRKTANN